LLLTEREGEVYASSLKEALETLLQEPPSFPGNPEPFSLRIEMKGA